MTHGLLTTNRERLLARYELALESVGRPELRELLASGTHRVRDVIEQRLAAQAVAAPRELADAAMALIDGLLFAELVAVDGRQRSLEELETALSRLVGTQ